MTTLAEGLEDMARLYRGYGVQLSEWLVEAGTPETGETAQKMRLSAIDVAMIGLVPGEASADIRLARLAALEESFMTRARVIGEAIEVARVRLSHRAGRNLTLREASCLPGAGSGAEKACAAASEAVAEVARRRVLALRRLETFCESVREERGKLAVARKLGKMYYGKRERGRRVDGHA